MNLTSPNNSRKIQDLLLNRVEGISWFYYNVDLNEALGGREEIYATQIEVEKFMEDINSDIFGKNKLKPGTKERGTTEILQFLASIIKANPKVLEDVIRRLFDVNEIRNESDAGKGLLGKFNHKDRAARNEIYTERIRNDHREKKGNIVVLAEGDSWFQFPTTYFGIDGVKDILDWLIEDEHYAVRSLAAGGDWFSNIFHSGEYIEELPKVSPDVFLVSGGGNDLVGNRRLALMVINPKYETPAADDCDQSKRLIELRSQIEGIDIKKYKLGLRYLSEEFFNFLNVYFIQFFVFSISLSNAKQYKHMLMITQGYDFTLPYHGSRAYFAAMQYIFSRFTDTGGWLFDPLKMKGIVKADVQEAIMYAMITEFNEMLQQLATFDGLPNLFHIDCRGVARNEDDWFDELHLQSETFEVISKTYKACMEENVGFAKKRKGKKNVYLARTYREKAKV
ncbi:hypothetical protein GGR28_003176 [Lewinella aquimaris]|uniref:Uncharacterized protein n=1 Tax=Neolewinella aquimaris TaxID=1835722 RepID=A0A840E9Y9_9BACT|nr:ABC transporter substrate-binding protein [Neolewinella aquimaris]MBB4080542.1 hypothetical protein [Neolewinella aquimaris]